MTMGVLAHTCLLAHLVEGWEEVQSERAEVRVMWYCLVLETGSQSHPPVSDSQGLGMTGVKLPHLTPHVLS